MTGNGNSMDPYRWCWYLNDVKLWNWRRSGWDARSLATRDMRRIWSGPGTVERRSKKERTLWFLVRGPGALGLPWALVGGKGHNPWFGELIVVSEFASQPACPQGRPLRGHVNPAAEARDVLFGCLQPSGCMRGTLTIGYSALTAAARSNDPQHLRSRCV
jgi:hypothetical protein